MATLNDLTNNLLIALTLASPAAAAQAGSGIAPESAPTEKSKVTRSQVTDLADIRAVGDQWRSLYAEGRLSEIPDLYTLDMVVMPRGRARIEGREQMRRAIGGLAAGRRVNIAVTEREAKVIGDFGWFIGDFKVTYTAKDAVTPPVTEFGRSMIIYRRDADGRWRIHRDIDSPAPHLGASAEQARIVVPPRDATPAMWDPAGRSVATECDRLSASRYDRTKLAPPVTRENIDVPATIAQCEADLLLFPGDPRINFQLGRLYGYAGEKEKTLERRQASAAAGNHNAIFLLGYLAWTAAADDMARCAAARDMKLAADRGNYSAQISYSSFFIEGRLDKCADTASINEVRAYLAAARPAVDGFFETRFADHLAATLQGQ